MTAHPVDVARLVFGAWLLARPNGAMRLVGDGGAWPSRATRLLGARYVVPASAGLVVRRRPPRWLDGAVDLAHALSMLAAARAFPAHRRLALTSGAVALGFGLADLSEPLR
jgi:hypothetical protein